MLASRVWSIYVREDRIKSVSLWTVMKVALQDREANDLVRDDWMKMIFFNTGVV